jgi:hypothetical protein
MTPEPSASNFMLFSFETACDIALAALFKEQDDNRRAWPDSYRSAQNWVTATELNRVVRNYAARCLKGEPMEGTDNLDYGVHLPRSLERCREYLLAQARAGKLTGHNFGRGHISGMRFRRAGTELTKAEQARMAKRSMKGS